MKSENLLGLDASISDRIARLSEEKRALLLARLQQTEANRKNKIYQRHDAEEAAPLSCAQERLWFLAQLSPQSSSYNEAGAIELIGKLNMDALERGLHQIVQRHEVLRSVFIAQADGQVRQAVAAESSARVKHIDLAALPAQQQSEQITRCISDEVRQPFDLSIGPLIRFTLLQLDAEKTILLVGLHHIIADEWSIRILIKELSLIYEAGCNNRPPLMDGLPIQYADYACWQREWLKGPAFDKQLTYWKRQLAGCSPLLELPADLPRPAALKHLGARYTFDLPAGLMADLRSLGKTQGATVFMTLAATFAVLLNRYTQQLDICIGYPIANRTRSELQGLIGFFANTLVLRADLSSNPTFSELLARVRKTCLEAQAHQDLPFEKLVEELAPGRDMSRQPLFQVMFVYQNADLEKLELSGIELNEIAVDSGNAKFDLTLSLKEEKGELKGCFEYSTELFYESTIIRWAGHYRQLLQEIIVAIDKPLSNRVMLTEEERRQIHAHWNDTKAEYPQNQCIHQLIGEQVKKNPHAIAVAYEERQITYEQLNTRANQLAHYLQAQGIGPEARVGVCVERSAEMIIAILAILKVGGAYVPMDPRYPKEHITHVMEDAMLQLVLTQEKLQELMPVWMERLLLDAQWVRISSQKTDAPECAVLPENLAYVIYTSGSTGKPKGVGVTHRNLVHSTSARLRYYQAVDGFLLLSSIAFDSSVAGIFGTLCQGGRLVLTPEESVLDVSMLAQTIASQKISHLLTVPSLHEVLLQGITGAEESLRSVIVAGESCKKSLVDRHHAYLPQVQLFNEYGPTEATVWSSVYECRANEDTVIAIGRPISNTRIYLLDAHLNPVPVGITGELYIGGVGLARGYLDQPDLTAARFIPDHLGEDGGRLYRTGDLARFRIDGNIEYIGRIDHQVKMRGFRIEPGQIEAALMQHEKVQQAVVMVRESAGGEERLVAYVVGYEQSSERDSMRAYLQAILPDYMVPSAFVFLECLPLTPNGKVDRMALPVPDYSAEHAHSYVAPRTPTEEKVAAIWAEVLRLERVGTHDHFFELGGHSLLIAQVIARVRRTFATDLPLRALFEKPVVADFALAIDALHGQDGELQALPLASAARDQALPLSYSQERLWFLDQFEGGSAPYNMPGAVRLTGELDRGVLRRSLNEIIRRHEVLRTTFALEEGRAVQVIAGELALEVEVTDLSGLVPTQREAEVQRRLTQEAQTPFDLAQGPLVRASLLSLGSSESAGTPEHVLLFTMHHIVSDGWSTAILIREFITLYEAYSKHQPSPLPELSIQYADYAQWQRNWLQGERLEQQVGYWKQQLAGAAAVLELPTDRPRPVVQSYRGATLYASIPQPVTEQLKRLGQRQNATLFMVLLAAFNILLSRYSGQTDLCVGTPVANRNRLEIEGLIGFFINTLVLRTDLSGNPSFTELLRRVREVCLGAQTHQDLPFEKLVEELAPVRDMSHHPLFQVMLALQNTPKTALEIAGLKITPEVLEAGAAKFDLDLEITEGKQGLAIQFSYNTDLFDAPTIARMAAHYGTLLENIAAAPDRLLSELELLTPPERNQLLFEWNATQADYPRNKRIHQLFEERAALNPDAIAVVFEGQQLTYGELNKKANQLAHYLNAQGVGPEVLVGICMERSLEMIVGILGILKAGGAYLPIDPELPTGRLRQILQHANVGRVLTVPELLGKIPEFCHAVCPGDEMVGGTQADADLPHADVDGRQLAYMLYTSGTTGVPKGVGVSHSNLVNQYFAWETAYELQGGDVHLQMARYTFDVFAGDWIRALCSGGKLVICAKETLLQPVCLYALMQQEQVTVAEFVPAVLRLLAEYLEESGQRLAFMKLLICGSDRWYVGEYKRFLKLCGDQTRLINSYGLTEATIDSTYFEAQQVKSLARELVPIGRGFANICAYILDQWLNPVPIGIPGELHIGGAGVVRGYFNRSELTAERFIPDLFSQKPGERLYKTGDVVRYLPDGNIEHLGRTDHQVKIRGFRIELGEIEATLLQHPAIAEAVVVASEQAVTGNQQLIAYVVSNEAAPDMNDVRMYLKAYLPDYMAPAAIVVLDCLPVNANGKIDRAALPAPNVDARFVRQFVAPRTPTEETIAAVWAEVLGLQQVGIHDNFFELGGHSLLVTQVISRIHTQLHIKIPLRTLFESATIAALADAVAAAQWQEINAMQKNVNEDEHYEDIAI